MIIERDKYAAEFGPEHPTVRNLDAQLAVNEKRNEETGGRPDRSRDGTDWGNTR